MAAGDVAGIASVIVAAAAILFQLRSARREAAARFDEERRQFRARVHYSAQSFRQAAILAMLYFLVELPARQDLDKQDPRQRQLTEQGLQRALERGIQAFLKAAAIEAASVESYLDDTAKLVAWHRMMALLDK